MWTTNKPCKEGYFWVEARGELTGKTYVHPVRVYNSKKDGKVDTVFSDGENFSINSDLFVKWYSEEIAMPAFSFKSKEDLHREKSKEKLRREYIEKNGKGCETCDRNPVNRGQRDTCSYSARSYLRVLSKRPLHQQNFQEGDLLCNEETGYPHYQEATRIYSIDVDYFC